MDGMAIDHEPAFYTLIEETGKLYFSPEAVDFASQVGGTVLESISVEAIFEPELVNKPKPPHTGGKTTQRQGKTEDGRGNTATDSYADYVSEQ